MDNENLVTLTADIVSAHVSNNTVKLEDVGALVTSVFNALNALGQAPVEVEPQEVKPAVSVRSSVKPDHLVCLVCGAHQTTLKRHLSSAHDMTPDKYRAAYRLPTDYPMAAPEYSAKRSTLAKAAGLGQGGRKTKRRAKGR